LIKARKNYPTMKITTKMSMIDANLKMNKKNQKWYKLIKLSLLPSQERKAAIAAYVKKISMIIFRYLVSFLAY
jgi:hypothetical protein